MEEKDNLEKLNKFGSIRSNIEIQSHPRVSFIFKGVQYAFRQTVLSFLAYPYYKIIHFWFVNLDWIFFYRKILTEFGTGTSLIPRGASKGAR